MIDLKDVLINILLMDGTADGLLRAEIPARAAIAYRCSRAQASEALNAHQEFDKPCVYLLLGSPESAGDTESNEDISRQKLYIGMAESARARIPHHFKSAEKEFWTHLILFTSKDAHLNTSHAKYLESELIRLGGEAKRASLQNQTGSRQPSLSHGDLSYVKSFLLEVLILCPLLGVTAFERVKVESPKTTRTFQPVSSPSTRSEETASESSSLPELRLKSGKASARGQYTSQGFVVLEGSLAVIQTRNSASDRIRRLRERLIETGVLSMTADGLRLTQDYIFSSPSAAASVFVGGESNGWEMWVDDHGRTLNKLEQRASSLQHVTQPQTIPAQPASAVSPMSRGPASVPSPSAPDPTTQADPGDDNPTLYLEGRETSAKAHRTAKGFIVHANSTGRLEPTPSFPAHARAIRDRLFQDGTIVESEGNILFVRGFSFGSPSTAAVVLLGRPANGLDEWKDKAGRTLNQLLQQKNVNPSRGSSRTVLGKRQ